MKRLPVISACAAALSFAAVSLPVASQTVYRSVEDGVTTFSDTPPDGPAEVIQIDVPPGADDEALERRLAQMRETTERMASDRRERERQRAELRVLSRSNAEVAETAPPTPATAWAGGSWPAYGWPPFAGRPRPGVRPPHRPRPHFPATGPVEAPVGWSVIQPRNDQLMRPVVSSRHTRSGRRR